MVVILFGVTGAGKTEVGRRLARELGWTFLDADEFHSPGNVDKMRGGLPLTDADRGPWLDKLRDTIERCLDTGENAVLACSALKSAYRDHLRAGDGVKMVHLKGEPSLIADRLRGRREHFMNPRLLQSQFETLEEPRPGTAVAIDVAPPPDQVVAAIRRELGI